MELKKILSIPVKKEEREYVLLLPDNCPIGEAYDVLHEMLAFIVEKSKESVERIKREDAKSE